MNTSGELAHLLDALAHLDEFDYNTLVINVPSGNIDEEIPKKKLPAAVLPGSGAAYGR